jgi:(+)-(1E,4E,6S,7R)-germacra-1(10),4-dien-6-ol synthase
VTAVAVLTQDGSHSLGEAVKVTVAMRNRAVALFLRLRDEVAADGSPELGRYVHGLGQWIRGYLDYSRLSPRYTDPRNQDDGAVAANPTAGWMVTDRLPVADVPLPELPSISSWWSRP